MNFTITKSAAKEITNLINNDSGHKIALRIAVDGGGCAGFMYQYSLVDQVNNDDLILEKEGVKLIIDPTSRPFLENCILEFREELGSSYFQISNPGATAKCGCGNSFAI